MAIRTYGLSGSGIDVDQMVSDLMKGQRATYDRLYQKKTQLEWKKADFSKLYKSISDFRTSLFNYRLQGTLQPKAASSSDSNYVTASAGPSAVNITNTIHVDQLASVATTGSSGSLGSVAGASNLSAQFAGGFSGSKTFTISNGTQTGNVTIDTDNETVYDLVSKINALNIGIKASYDASVDRFSMTTTKTGKDQTIDITGADQTWFTNTFQLANNTTGTNANFTLNGSTYNDLNSNITSNTVSIAGVTYTLKNTMAAGVNATVSVSADIEKTVSAVKGLIDAYNKLLTEVNGEVSEEAYRNFTPLTDAQRKEMKDSEITAWEEKAKSGMLRRDPILTEMMNKIRNDITGVVAGVGGDYTTAASLGITTGQYFSGGSATGESSLRGVLYVNEDKLRSELQKDPTAAFTVFGTLDLSDPNDPSKDGLTVRLYDSLDGFLKRIKTQAGATASVYDTSNYGKQLSDYQDQMTAMERRLEMVQNRYYNQFNAMETAISRLNQQSAWLGQSLGQQQ